MTSTRKLVYAAVLATTLAQLAPRPARAAGDCAGSEIASCNADFGGGGIFQQSVLGWCYMVRLAICSASY